MKPGEIAQGDLLYHATHGLCRVDGITKESQAGKVALCYSLVPKTANRMKARFVIWANDIKISGFHVPVSLKEANKILESLKSGDIKKVLSGVKPKAASLFAQENQTWTMARDVLSFSKGNLEAKDQRKRQMLENSARGLVGELAVVFKTSMREAAEMVRKSLGSISKINPTVLTALEHAGED